MNNMSCSFNVHRSVHRNNILVYESQQDAHFTVYLTLRLLMSYIYGAPNLDVSRSHTTTHHSR